MVLFIKHFWRVFLILVHFSGWVFADAVVRCEREKGSIGTLSAALGCQSRAGQAGVVGRWRDERAAGRRGLCSEPQKA